MNLAEALAAAGIRFGGRRSDFTSGARGAAWWVHLDGEVGTAVDTQAPFVIEQIQRAVYSPADGKFGPNTLRAVFEAMRRANAPSSDFPGNDPQRPAEQLTRRVMEWAIALAFHGGRIQEVALPASIVLPNIGHPTRASGSSTFLEIVDLATGTARTPGSSEVAPSSTPGSSTPPSTPSTPAPATDHVAPLSPNPTVPQPLAPSSPFSAAVAGLTGGEQAALVAGGVGLVAVAVAAGNYFGSSEPTRAYYPPRAPAPSRAARRSARPPVKHRSRRGGWG